MNPNPEVIERTIVHLNRVEEANRGILQAINAGHRMRLLEEKNRRIEEFETATGLSKARPSPLPDYPVLDLRAMDDLLVREAELERLAEVEPPRFTLRSKIGLAVAISMILVTISIVSFQVSSFNSDIRPVITSEEGRRAQVIQILNEVGDRETIQSAVSIAELEAKLQLVREGVRALALGGTDEALEEELNQRRESIKKQIARMRQERARR